VGCFSQALPGQKSEDQVCRERYKESGTWKGNENKNTEWAVVFHSSANYFKGADIFMSRRGINAGGNALLKLFSYP